MSYVGLDPDAELLVVPGCRDKRVVLGCLGFGDDGAEHLGVAQRVLAGADVGQAGVDAGHDDRLAAADAGRVEDVLEGLGEGALPEGDVDGLLGWFSGVGVGVGEGPAPDAVLEDRQAGVDLARFFHAACVVRRLVACGLGSREIDHVEETVVGCWHLGILKTEPANGVGARRGVVFECRCRAPEGGGRFDEAKEGVLVTDLEFLSACHLGDAQGVFEYGDLLPGVEEV